MPSIGRQKDRTNPVDDISISSLSKAKKNIQDAREDCPLCGGNSSEIICEKPMILRCLFCRHGFRPNPLESIVRGYSGPVSMPTFFEAMMFARHHYDFIDKNVGFEKVSSLLEIGPGDGALLRMIRRKHPRINLTGVEPSVELCRRLRKIPELKVVNSYIEEFTTVQRFDLVIMSHILEHVEKPGNILTGIYADLLNPGGHLYIDVPNQDFELGNSGMTSLAPPGHLFFFNGISFPKLLSAAGFPRENICGVKYSTIPESYPARMEMIAGLAGSRGCFAKIRLFREKAMKRISLRVSVPIRILLNRRPEEMPLEESGRSHNNMAIIARK